MSGWTTGEAPRVETLTVGVNKDVTVEVSSFPKEKSIVEQICGARNVRYFERAAGIVDGRWFAVSFYNLSTVAWDGSAWSYLVEIEADLPNKERIDAIATDGTRAWAVTTTGGVHLWNGSTWETAIAEHDLFVKGRRFMRVAYDRARERVVMWGGQNGNRASNDTLFFQNGDWRKSSKSGTKLANRKDDHYWTYDDTARGGIVRIGVEGAHLLDGDAWKPLELGPPAHVVAKPHLSYHQFVIAHDPASKQTLWLDPLAGDLYREGAKEPFANVGLAPGLIAHDALTKAGAYFWTDYQQVNEDNWMWGWDPVARRVLGMPVASAKHVVSLDLGAYFEG